MSLVEENRGTLNYQKWLKRQTSSSTTPEARVVLPEPKRHAPTCNYCQGSHMDVDCKAHVPKPQFRCNQCGGHTWTLNAGKAKADKWVKGAKVVSGNKVELPAPDGTGGFLAWMPPYI